MAPNQEYTHDGCTTVGEKHLISVNVDSQSNYASKITIRGKGVKLFVMKFTNEYSDSGGSILGEKIDSNGSKTMNYGRSNGFIFILGVPN